MAVHFDLVKEINHRNLNNLNLLKLDDQLFICRALLHAADLSSPVRPFKIARSWAGWISEEFNYQVQFERSLGIKVTSHLEGLDALKLAENEIFFVDKIAKPMWEAMVKLYPSLNHLMGQLEDNLKEYKILKEKIEFHDNFESVVKAAGN